MIEILKTGAAYIRVSTGKQEELSPDSQRRLILDYAKAHDISIPEEFIFLENGISGRKADKRPEFQKMIALAKAKKFDTILLWKFSRFARNQEESIVYKSMLRKINIDVVSISEPLVDGPFGSLIERIIEWMDEFYSIRLAGDVTRGMTEKAMRGGYQCKPPLGYQIPYHNAVLQVVPEEAEIIRFIFNSYVKDQLSIYQIAKLLNAKGYKTSRGREFEKRSVEYILSNPCYMGMVRWNRTENATNTIKEQEEWIVRKGEHEAIIAEDIFLAAQTRKRSETVHRHMRPSETYSHWLSGLLRCSSCGRTLVTSHSKNRTGNIYYSFQCYGYSKGKCLISHSVSVLKLQPILLSALREIIDSGNIDYDLKQPSYGNSEDENVLIQKQLERLDIKEKRIKEAYLNEVDTLSEYKDNKSRLELERQRLLKELEKVPKEPKEVIDRIMLSRLNSVYDMLLSDKPIAEKSKALKSVVEKIVVNKFTLHLDIYYYYIPGFSS